MGGRSDTRYRSLRIFHTHASRVLEVFDEVFNCINIFTAMGRGRLNYTDYIATVHFISGLLFKDH